MITLTILAWLVAANLVADMYVETDPQFALGLDPHNPLALTNLAQETLGAAKEKRATGAQEAARIAIRLIARDPLAPGALTLYGKTKDRLEEFEHAKKAFHVAASLQPMDFAAHKWLLKQAAEKGDYARAFTEFDILLRGRPYLVEELDSYLVDLIAEDKNANKDLARRLAASPPWRTSLLNMLPYNDNEIEPIIELFGYVQSSAAPPNDQEMSLYLDRLVRDKRYDAAWSAWSDHITRQGRQRFGLLYNAAFQYPASNLPFDWQIIPIDGAVITIGELQKEKELSVSFYHSRVRFSNVRHLLRLPAGEYALSGAYRLDGLSNERGLRWRVFCVEDPEGSLGVTAPMKGTKEADAFRADVTVPPTNCATQSLVLEIPARIDAETEISGAAHFSNINIKPSRPASK